MGNPIPASNDAGDPIHPAPGEKVPDLIVEFSNEDDNLLLRLNEVEDPTWKEIHTRFKNKKGESFLVPALQMRLKRVREQLQAETADEGGKTPAHIWVEKKAREGASVVSLTPPALTYLGIL